MNLQKNYGNNLRCSFFKKNYIIGNKFNVSLVITMSIIFTLVISLWILFLFNTISKFIIIFGIFLYFLLIYNYLKSFFTEPGIIPRSYPKYILNKVKSELTTDSENNLFKIINNKTSSIIALDLDENGLKNLEQVTEKNENKIFPDFILAESNENIKINNMNLNNSITTGYNIDNIYQKNKNKSFQKDIYMYSKKSKMNENSNNNGSSILKHIKENNTIYNGYTPRIFTKRPCNTCNIIRPPKTSHCVICDNCIMEMDHHCFYISNCIGIRNRKYFVFFLFYGFTLSILCIITCLYHLVLIFLIKNEFRPINKSLIKSYYILIIVSFIIMIIGFFILLFKKESLKISCIIFIIGNIFFDIIFYINKNKYYPLFKKSEYHPFSFCLAYAIFPMFIFVSKYLRKQIKLIGKDLTYKQYMSIKEERNNNKNNKEIFYYLDSILKRKVHFKNIFNFILLEKKKSLINE